VCVCACVCMCAGARPEGTQHERDLRSKGGREHILQQENTLYIKRTRSTERDLRSKGGRETSAMACRVRVAYAPRPPHQRCTGTSLPSNSGRLRVGCCRHAAGEEVEGSMRRGGGVSKTRRRKRMFAGLCAKALAPCMEPSSVCVRVRARAACVCLCPCARACVPAGLGAQVHARSGNTVEGNTVEVGKGNMRHQAHHAQKTRQGHTQI